MHSLLADKLEIAIEHAAVRSELPALLLDLAAACAHPISAKEIARLARKCHCMCQLDGLRAHALEREVLLRVARLLSAVTTEPPLAPAISVPLAGIQCPAQPGAS